MTANDEDGVGIMTDAPTPESEAANLRGANLRWANLSSADLSSADLRGANLRSADLSSADLSSADLSSADLRSADLSSANLRVANLHDANLRDADLRDANLCDANLRSANLDGARLPAKLAYRVVWAGGPRSRLVRLWRWDCGPLRVALGCIHLVDPTPAEWAQAFDEARGDDWDPADAAAAADAVRQAIRTMSSIEDGES